MHRTLFSAGLLHPFCVIGTIPIVAVMHLALSSSPTHLSVQIGQTCTDSIDTYLNHLRTEFGESRSSGVTQNRPLRVT
jgi:hypothetical protein